MGNYLTNSFTNLDDIPKEKSLHSFNVTLVEICDKNKYETEINKNISYKLKLYPSTLTLKNDYETLDFLYNDVLTWEKSKQFFTFTTSQNMSYSFITETADIAINIVVSLKDKFSNRLY